MYVCIILKSIKQNICINNTNNQTIQDIIVGANPWKNGG